MIKSLISGTNRIAVLGCLPAAAVFVVAVAVSQTVAAVAAAVADAAVAVGADVVLWQGLLVDCWLQPVEKVLFSL